MCRLCDWGEIYPPRGAEVDSARAEAAEAERQRRSKQLWAQLLADTDGLRTTDCGLKDSAA